jgi:hypothetical protein
MPLFQKIILAKYLQSQNKNVVSEKWNDYKKHFFNPKVQENIRESKEEQYQEGFLIDLFVNILGYTKNPTPDFNLTTELKNVKDGKKADGAIILPKSSAAANVGRLTPPLGGGGLPSNVEGLVIGIIELKSMATTDLGKIEAQAFGYKNNQKECLYVITSNFEKLRLYVDNAVEHIEFNLFRLTEKEFEVLYLCLAFENIKKGVPKRLKDESLNQEDAITKRLYQDYLQFKHELYLNLVALNPQFDSLLLFKKSQKLLDRFLFVFFAEDRNLLQPNSIRMVIKFWKTLKNWQDYKPLYEVYQKFFSFLNSGIRNEELEVFPYNGGLFAKDAVLDVLKIDDQVLYFHTLKMSEYDFLSEVDVTILGHIFENSLDAVPPSSPLIPAGVAPQSLAGGVAPQPPKGGVRKKDGIFYTPKYITKYIVENTVGRLCKEEKERLQIVENEYVADKKRKKNDTQFLLDKLKNYRNLLLDLTIIDPACGSGAFLNEALNFLIAEHEYIDELQAKLFGDSLVLSDVEKSILENNLFGVDLNEESVEIAKLSLWLRTARPNRQLNDLNNNIKCGNSLIDKPEIAGEKAFDWKKEFPQIFAKGGFDVVIGNPPYGAEINAETQNYLNKRYIKGGSETVISFTKLAYDFLLKENGAFGFIIPKSFTFSSNYEAIRNYILGDISEIIDCKKVWKEVLLEQVMFFFKKNSPSTHYRTGKLINEEVEIVGNIDKTVYAKFGFYLNDVSERELSVGLKIVKIGFFLKDIASNSRGGIFQNKISEKGDTEVLGGAEIQRYGIVGIKGKIDRDWVKEDDKCFISPNSILVQRMVAHIEKPTDHIKITAFVPTNNNYVIVDTINQITFIEKYNHKVFWCLLNSTLLNWYCYRFIFAKAIRTMQFDNPITNRIPIPKNINQQPFIEKADLVLGSHKDLQKILKNVQDNIQREFNLAVLPKKLQNWHELNFADFLKELEKQNVKLKLPEKTEWGEYFGTESKKAIALQTQIQQTDKEIDALVYALYELTEEEIKIVENGR